MVIIQFDILYIIYICIYIYLIKHYMIMNMNIAGTQFNYFEIYFLIYIIKYYTYTVKPLYKKLFFFSTFFLIERFSYKEVFTFPMILRINL